jgi:hypothetical protein
MLNLTLTMPHPPLGTFSPERREKERDLLRRGNSAARPAFRIFIIVVESVLM